MIPRQRWLRIVGFGCLLAAAIAGAWFAAGRNRTANEPTYRMGYGSFPPYFVIPKNQPPTGFSVEVVREAARRQGIRLTWERYTVSTDKALINGELDLFPMLAMVPDRIGKVEFSEPWWENTLVVISRLDAPIRSVADSTGKTISLIHASFGLQRMKEQFPAAVPLPEREYTPVVSNVCKGKANGAILEARLAAALTLLPECSGIDLTMAWFPDLNLTYGVGARKGLKPVADRLQAEIVRMAQDGTMTRIGEPWGVQVTNQRKLFDALVESEVRGKIWLYLAAVSALVAAGFGLLWHRLTVARRSAEEAQKRAEQALAARSQFVANISHEIRTPLNGMLGMTEILRDTGLDGAQRECAELLDSSGQTLLAMINELLDFSKLEAGKLSVETLAFSPREAAREVCQLFEPRASANGVAMVFEVGGSVPSRAAGDPVRLRQILNNLVSNAVKFTRRGDIVVSVSVSPDGEDPYRLRFSVKDTGPGIPKEIGDRIFEPFVQGDGTTSRRYGGTGLGLAICRELVDLMGGQIRVTSEPGRGSEFLVDLPFQPASANLPVESGRYAVAAEGELGLRLLVAEDNTINQRVLTTHLDKLGCTWTMVSDGVQAVEKASQESYDAILMDGQMPLLDGFAATRQIRALPEPFGAVPIIGVTACAFEEDRVRGLDAGMQSILTKPFTIRELRSCLTQIQPAQKT